MAEPDFVTPEDVAEVSARLLNEASTRIIFDKQIRESVNQILATGVYEVAGLSGQVAVEDLQAALSIPEDTISSIASILTGAQSATSNTAIGTAAKTVTIPDYTPSEGDVLFLKLNNGNNADSPTLNINGAGAVDIQLGGQPADVTA